MKKITLRKPRVNDKKYFARWWRDTDLLRLTSGILKSITDREVEKYFIALLRSKKNHHFMILLRNKPIGHVSLSKRKGNRYETQIVIGEKQHWNKGYGTYAIELLIKKAKTLGISKVYLEVRPTNKRAINAYKNCGFKKIDIKRNPKNKYLPKAIIMELRHS
ncbi:MAG: GNAT family N-acetyltransferase [Patescibacteria group bacterium]